MNELIKIEMNDNQEPVIDGRQLHEVLEVGTPYDKWFPRMCEYGFIEDKDFSTFLSESTGGRPSTNHVLKLDMAKEIAMLQRSERGKEVRQYFIQIEKDYNSPEKIMARALLIADKRIKALEIDNSIKDQQIAELMPKASYYDLILQCKDLLAVTTIAKDYGMTATRMNKILHSLGVQFKQSGVWFLYAKYQDKGYTHTKTQNYNRNDGTQGAKAHTYWTQKGRLFLYEILKANGYLPMIEQEDEQEQEQEHSRDNIVII